MYSWLIIRCVVGEQIVVSVLWSCQVWDIVQQQLGAGYTVQWMNIRKWLLACKVESVSLKTETNQNWYTDSISISHELLNKLTTRINRFNKLLEWIRSTYLFQTWHPANLNWHRHIQLNFNYKCALWFCIHPHPVVLLTIMCRACVG
jgi:hypothetical protein